MPYSVSSIQVGNAQVNGSSVGVNATLNATADPTGNLRRPFVGPYINFTEPINTTSYGYNGTSALGDHFQWLYASYNSSQNTTTVNVFKMDHSAPLHYNETSFTVQDEFHILAHSQKCLVLYEPSNWYTNGSTIKMFRENSGTYQEETQNLFNLVGGNSATDANATKWHISQSCDRMRVGSNFFLRNSTGHWNAMNNNATLSAQDLSFEYAVSSNGSLYKFSPSTETFAPYFTPASPLPTQGEISISVYSNRIFVNATELVNPNSSNSSSYYSYSYNTQANATKVSLFAFLVESSGVSSVFNFTDSKFVIKPEIEASPQLTKVFVVGNGNTSNGSYAGLGYGFHIDWAAKTVDNITLPDEVFEFGREHFVTAGEEFFMVKHIKYNQTYSWQPYHIQYNWYGSSDL